MSRREAGSWHGEARTFCRAFSGAFLFGIPLLFTMEMWSLGSYTAMWKLLVMLSLALFANFSLSYFASFRHDRQRSFGGHLGQAIDAVAVGAVASAIVLLVLNRISFDHPVDSILGKIIVQIVPLSIGASIAHAVFGTGQNRQGNEQGRRPEAWRATINDVGATAAGGIFIGFNFAPTDEIPMLAAELGSGHMIAMIGLSLLITYAIVFESGFDPDVHRRRCGGLFNDPMTETAMAYAVSLLVAVGALYLFGGVRIGDPIGAIVAQALVLGLPTAVGGAAGRLVV